MDDRIRNIAFEFQGHTWKAKILGSGSRYMLVFHGYGQQSSAFTHLAELLEESYSLVLMDLVYHGDNSEMQAGYFYTPEHTSPFIDAICRALKAERISLAGYSIGARIAMSISTVCLHRIDELWLFAPDGMPVSGFYKFLTSSLIGNSLFRGFVKRPHFVFGLIKLGQVFRLIKPKAAQFYRYEISDLNKRQQLFNTWMAYRAAIPNHRILNETIPAIVCILGKEDSIIPFAKTIRYIYQHLPKAQVYELDAGHNILSDKSIKKFSEHWETKTKKRHRAASET
jgi:pimeloyl-ACP methyl ester carboxylesterase